MNTRRPAFRAVLWFAGLIALLAGCALPPNAAPARVPLLLISLDAFRWDYPTLHSEDTPRLRELARTGASAASLIPVFPSNTFANHYTIVTGLYPAHHGIINNRFFDPKLGRPFVYNVTPISSQSVWWRGEPIWVTAGRQGRISATSFWPGSEAVIRGRRPDFWKPFDLKAKFEDRMEELVGWMKLPPDKRPAIVTFYLELTNAAGHAYGPASPELGAAAQTVDRQIGTLLDRLQAEGVAFNVMVVSDHGMADVALDRVAVVDDYLDLTKVQVDFDESVLGLRPLDGDVDGLLRALAKLPPHYRVYRAADLPARFHLSGTDRIPPVWVVPDEGWEIYRKSTLDPVRANFHKGQHGYDPAYPSMHGILIASGPSFRACGLVVDSVENVHVYNLMCAALGLKPAPNDGDDRLVKALLK